jgi:long-chain acyl-CoA synthetase
MISTASVDINELSVYEVLKVAASERPNEVAYKYLGCEVTYSKFLAKVDDLSYRFRKMGVCKGDRVIICLPNCPQALESFYALSRIGAVNVMVHPLSSKNEIEFYIKDSGSKMAITLSKFMDNFPKIGSFEGFQTLIVTSPVDSLPKIKGKIAQLLYKDARMPKGSLGFGMIRWNKMLKDDVEHVYKEIPEVSVDDPVAILYTGGTTGRNKGAVHSSRSFNTTAWGMKQLSGLYGQVKVMMAEMPMFHGFGLCTCIHLPICWGLKIILIPTFTLDSLCKTIVKEKVDIFAGVPTLFEKMVGNKYLQTDLSFIKGMFCGGDSISIPAKERVDKFFQSQGCETRVRVGFGCTECLTATAITPKDEERPGSVGVPIPGYSYKIVDPDTMEEVPDGADGEMCITGPSLMLGYYNNPEETANVLRKHDDGKVWLHTGDIGYIDDGFIYFKNRIKRIIITSGYNVYPQQIEQILSMHPLVDSSCVIGVPDEMRGTKVKAVVVLKIGVERSSETLNSISNYVKANIASYAKPRDYEFVDSLPKTKLGKIDYRKLELEAAEAKEKKE